MRSRRGSGVRPDPVPAPTPGTHTRGETRRPERDARNATADASRADPSQAEPSRAIVTASDHPGFRGRERGAYRAPLAWLTLILVLVLGTAADLGTKWWSFETVAHRPVRLDRERLLADPSYDPVPFRARRPLLPAGIADLKLVLNPGAVFGLGAHQRWFFIVFTIGALAAGVHLFGRHTTASSYGAHVAIGLVMAGGVGNLIDRIAYGRVRDFIHVLPGRRLPFDWTWPGTQNPEMFPWVFNVADVLLLVGMVILMLRINRMERKRKTLEGATEQQRNDEATEGLEAG